MEEKNNIESINWAGKNNPFSVPDNYFETFPEKLRNRLQTEKPTRVNVFERLWNLLRPQFALVAVITGFALLGYFGFRHFVHTEQVWLNDDNIAEYIYFYQHEFHEHHLLRMLEDDYPDPDDALYFEDAFYYEDSDAYIDYLYYDNIDIDLIIEEL